MTFNLRTDPAKKRKDYVFPLPENITPDVVITTVREINTYIANNLEGKLAEDLIPVELPMSDAHMIYNYYKSTFDRTNLTHTTRGGINGATRSIHLAVYGQELSREQEKDISLYISSNLSL